MDWTVTMIVDRKLVIGRRGVFLLLFGSVYLIYGAALLAEDANPALHDIFRFLAHHHLDLEVYDGIPWITAGIVAIITGVAHPKNEWFGFVSLYFVAGLWVVLNFLELIIDVFDGYDTRAWAGVIIWGLVVGVILLVSGWPDPPPSTPYLTQSRELPPIPGEDLGR